MPLQSMTATDRLYSLIQTLSEEQINEVLHLAEFLQQKQTTTRQQSMPPGTLTGLRGIAKNLGAPPNDQDLQEDYIDYLTQKCQ